MACAVQVAAQVPQPWQTDAMTDALVLPSMVWVVIASNGQTLVQVRQPLQRSVFTSATVGSSVSSWCESMPIALAAQALAAIRGRSYVIPDDIKCLAVPALAHRLVAKREARLRGKSLENIVSEVVASLPVPVEDERRR